MPDHSADVLTSLLELIQRSGRIRKKFITTEAETEKVAVELGRQGLREELAMGSLSGDTPSVPDPTPPVRPIEEFTDREPGNAQALLRSEAVFHLRSGGTPAPARRLSHALPGALDLFVNLQTTLTSLAAALRDKHGGRACLNASA